MDFTIENCLVCDDVRREISSKDILIGVYSSTINIPSLPANVNLCFWMLVLPKKLGNLVIDLKIEIPGNPNPALVKVETEVVAPIRGFSIFTPQATYPIFQVGDMKLFTRPFGTDRWRMNYKIAVDYAPPSFSTPSN